MSNKNLPRGKRREMGLIEDSDFICPPLKLEETIKPFCSEHNGELKFRDQQIYVSSSYMKCENGDDDMKYIWATTLDPGYPCSCILDTVEECIEYAKRCGIEPGEFIYVGEYKPVEIGGIYLDDILKNVESDMSDRVGDSTNYWNISSTFGAYSYRKPIYKKYERKLKQLVNDYIKEIDEIPHFYTMVNPEKIIVE